MGETWITDMTHFEGMPPHMVRGPAGRIARYLGSIVAAAATATADVWVDTSVSCRRRPGRKLCPGRIRLQREGTDGPIEWHCTSCDDRGLISNWRGTTWDPGSRVGQAGVHRLTLSAEELRVLRRIPVLSPGSRHLVTGAVTGDEGAVIEGTPDAFHSLLADVAGAIKYEGRSRRRTILGQICARLGEVVGKPIGAESGKRPDRQALALSPKVEHALEEIQRRFALRGGKDKGRSAETIRAEVVEATWQRMAGLSPRGVERLVQRMAKEQPVVLAYLLAVDHDLLNQDERELLVYLGVVVWQTMSQSSKPLPRVTEKMLDQAEVRNLAVLQYPQGQDESSFVAVARGLAEGHGQPHVMKYIIEALMEEDGEDSRIRAEHKGIIWVNLMTVLDCFDR